MSYILCFLFVLSIGNVLFEFDLVLGKLSSGHFCGEGIRPLIFNAVKGLSLMDDGIYFGGYLGNKDKMPVGVYKRVSIDQWKIVFTFTLYNRCTFF